MEARIERNWPRRTVNVWLTQSHGAALQVLQHKGGGDWSYVNLSESEILPVEPTFELPDGAVEALVKAAGDFLPPSAAIERHLKDAIGVRDRMISLVEAVIRQRDEEPAKVLEKQFSGT